MQNHGQLGRLANEAGVAMAHANHGQNGGGHLRSFAEVSSLSTVWNVKCSTTPISRNGFGLP